MAATNPAIVISPQFVVPYQVVLVVTTKIGTLNEGEDFGVTDVNGKIMLRGRECSTGKGNRRIVLDHGGSPLLTIKEKALTMHKRWRVYKGGSSNPNDLLFSFKKSSMIQLPFTPKFNVYLGLSKKESVPDLQIRGRYIDGECSLYLGKSNTILAKMHRHYNITNSVIMDGTYGVTVCPNVDYAFAVALCIILHEIYEEEVVHFKLAKYPEDEACSSLVNLLLKYYIGLIIWHEQFMYMAMNNLWFDINKSQKNFFCLSVTRQLQSEDSRCFALIDSLGPLNFESTSNHVIAPNPLTLPFALSLLTRLTRHNSI